MIDSPAIFRKLEDDWRLEGLELFHVFSDYDPKLRDSVPRELERISIPSLEALALSVEAAEGWGLLPRLMTG